MKKLLLSLALCTIALPYTVQGAEISVDYNGVCVDNQMETKPYFQQDRIFLGVRDIALLTGSELTWDEASKTAHFATQGQKNSFSAGNHEVTIVKEGQTTKKTMDVSPELVGERLYVPIGFVKDLGGMAVTWKPKEQKLVLANQNQTTQMPIADQKNGKTVLVTEAIPYAPEDENIDAIVSYIKRNFNENFDVTQFFVETNIGGIPVGDKLERTWLSFHFLEHGFLSDAAYHFTVTQGVVTSIRVVGSPLCSEENKRTINEDGVDAKALLAEGRKKLVVKDGYTMVAETVEKQYDTEDFYQVRFRLRESVDAPKRSRYNEVFEFRNEGGAWVLQKEAHRLVGGRTRA